MLVNAFSIAFMTTDFIHHSRSGVNSNFDETTDLQGNHSYKVQVTLTDDDEWEAVVQGSMEVYIDGELVETKTFSSYDWQNSDDDARATDTESVWLYPETDCQLRVVIEMDTGDEWSYVLFDNLPVELENHALFYGISGVLGIIFILGFVLLHLRYYNESYFAQHGRKDTQIDRDETDESVDEELGVKYYD
jgi:hypothetical protein